MCECVCEPPCTAEVGPMSLMHIWTKLYSQLGQPLPKVWLLFLSFCHVHWVEYEHCFCNILLSESQYLLDDFE